MRKSAIWIASLAVTHALFFVGGAALGRHNALTGFVGQTKDAEAQVSLGRYTVYRDMAIAITGARYDRAKCTAEVLASSMLDDVKRCVADSGCRSVIEANAQKMAPEALGQAPLPFKYIEVNRTSCG